MKVQLHVQNQSTRKHLYRRTELQRIAERVCKGEGVVEEVEISLLLCDDPLIQELNQTYRKKNAPTDVLSFPQEDPGLAGVVVLGDIVISLETVERQCASERPAMAAEVRLLFCHGLLHLLGHDHATREDERRMQEKQAEYLGVDVQAAWRQHRKQASGQAAEGARGKRKVTLGRGQ